MSAPVQIESGDVTIHGPHTRHRGVRWDAEDRREWMLAFTVVPALGMHQIMHTGVATAFAPYRVVRTRQINSYFLACFGGTGEVLVDGRWHECHEGMAFLLPPHILNAFRASGPGGWDVCWVCYRQPPQQRPLASASAPILARFESRALRCAIEGLVTEAETTALAGELHRWVELVHGYVLRFARPERTDEALWGLWEKVEASLDTEWTLPQLAREVSWSTEHLRRLCQKMLGRSPMQQVIYLRMRQAAKLLLNTDDKIETIAHAVGYQNSFVFSTTFRKTVGWSPSEYRARAPQGREITGAKS